MIESSWIIVCCKVVAIIECRSLDRILAVSLELASWQHCKRDQQLRFMFHRFKPAYTPIYGSSFLIAMDGPRRNQIIPIRYHNLLNQRSHD